MKRLRPVAIPAERVYNAGVALNLEVKEEQQERTTRQTVPPRRQPSPLNEMNIPGYNSYGNNALFGRLPVRNLNAFDISTLDLLELDPLAALELLPLIFPDASLAVHNILRLGNPGWEIKCFHRVTGKEDKRAGRLCTEMFENANRGVDCDIPGALGGPDSLINSLLFSAYLKGAVAVETVLDETLTGLEDIVAVDPFTIDMPERTDKRGRYRIFQIQQGTAVNSTTTSGDQTVPPVQTMPSQSGQSSNINGQQNRVELNPNLFTYVPLDDTLYGRSMVAPALQVLIFWTRYYVALQVFLHNLAFGDKDGEIDTSLLLTILDRNMPQRERAKWERDFWGELIKLIGRFADDYKQGVKNAPNSAMIHSDLLKMSALGTARTAYPVEEVMKVCKREIYAALKMLPVLMGANDTVTETHASVQMQIFTSGLNYIQGAVKHAIERSLLTGLRASAYPRDVRVELIFNAISMEDRLKAANAERQELQNESFKRDEGWITQDEASENGTGSPAVTDGPNGEPADNPLYERQTPVAPTPAKPGQVEPLPTDGSGELGVPSPAPKNARRGKSASSGFQMTLSFGDSPVFTYATNAPNASGERPELKQREEVGIQTSGGFAGNAAANRAGRSSGGHRLKNKG